MSNYKLQITKLIWPLGGVAAALLIYFIFIPAFAGRLAISHVVQVGPLALRWYGLILALAILTSYFIIRKNSWKFGISQEAVDDFSFWLTIVGIIGARFYYVIFNLDYFSKNWNEVYQIWQGGLSIYGAVLAGLGFVYFYTRKRVYNFWQIADLLALGLPLGQAIGRFGNFINQEAFGVPTSLPWKMYVAPLYRPIQFAQEKFFHPAFLYEALANVLIFILLYKLVGKHKPGTIALAYLASYSLFRFFIEAVRLDSFIIQGFRVDQVIAFMIFITAASLLLHRYGKIAPKA